MTVDAILLCRGPASSHWQLGPLPPAHGSLALLGWKLMHTTPDAGVPESIAVVLARALTRVAAVTFPCSELGARATPGGTAHRCDQLTIVTSPGETVAKRIHLLFRREPSSLALLSTRNPARARELFEDAAHPWWLQGQFVVLSDPDEPPPRLDRCYEDLLRLLEPEWADSLPHLAEYGIGGVLKPGVDGDVIGLLTVSESYEDRLLMSFMQEGQAVGLAWLELPETEFAQALSC